MRKIEILLEDDAELSSLWFNKYKGEWRVSLVANSGYSSAASVMGHGEASELADAVRKAYSSLVITRQDYEGKMREAIANPPKQQGIIIDVGSFF